METTSTRTNPRLMKKTIAQIYNKINQRFYDTGVVSQRIQIFDDRIIIFAQQKRIAALNVLSKNYRELTVLADAALIAEFKAQLKEEMEAVTGLKVLSVLKDFDPETNHACSIIIFDQTGLKEDLD